MPTLNTIGLYAIVDKVAHAIVGIIMMHRHPAAAIRSFDDAARAQGSGIARHPDHYHLLHVGDINDETFVITPTSEITLDGGNWATLNAAKEERQ